MVALPLLARVGPLLARPLAECSPFSCVRTRSAQISAAAYLSPPATRTMCSSPRINSPSHHHTSSPILRQLSFRAQPHGLDLFRRLSTNAAIRSAAAPTLDASHADMATEGAAEPIEHDAPTTTKRSVAYHLFFCAALVYLIIVVGGLTRLTESGLSITEWNPGFKGMRLPWSDAEWTDEWEKYKSTPEWAILNRHMTVDDFKSIYLWEWSHRMIGRLIGVAFVVPAAYFLARGRVAPGTRWKLAAIALGIGFQGALGWFMVKSGLSAPTDSASPPSIAATHPHSTVPHDTPLRLDGQVSTAGSSSSTSDWHPRVSHFRLAAHLGTAFAVYLGMLHTGLAILRDDAVAHGRGRVAGLSVADGKGLEGLLRSLGSGRIGRLRFATRAMLGLAFVTAMTGALVAGLDAGLVYSEFPYMGDGFVPPREEILDDRFAWSKTQQAPPSLKTSSGTITTSLVLGNATQNPVTVQLMHRCLAVSTLISALALGVYARRVSRSVARTLTASQRHAFMPPSVPRWAALVSATAVMQASLGISTLIYLVPIELASAHQAGSVALLSAIVALLAALRRPNGRVMRLVAQRRGGEGVQSLQRQAVISRALNKIASERAA